ncbi:MAG: GNAT family N-acetyltransferase [Microthrixaceae bacterium]
MSSDAATALAEASASTGPVRRVNGPADAVATFAGAFATITGAAARPVGGERIYEASSAQIVGDPVGRRRPATEADYETIVDFVAGFGAETGTGHGGPDADRQRAAGFIEAGRLHVWEVDGHPVASAVVIPPASRVSRVTFVYTLPDHRGRGFASRLVSELTAQIISEGAQPILYTQLENPISNRLYQRIGYKVVSEQLRYEFELPEDGIEPRIS